MITKIVNDIDGSVSETHPDTWPSFIWIYLKIASGEQPHRYTDQAP
jgi:hypothetical protein